MVKHPVSERETGFSWRGDDCRSERSGVVTFGDISPFLPQLTAPPRYLLLTLPQLNLDFTALDDGTIEMELMDATGDQFAVLTVAQAEEVARRALTDWHASALSTQLTDLDLEWL